MSAMTITITSIPSGPGYVTIREPYLGCTFTLADPASVDRVRQEMFRELDVPAPSGHAVRFTDVLTGLRNSGRYDWATYLEERAVHPQLVFFPEDCARLKK